MNDNDSKGISYMAGFFMLIAFVIAGLVLASMLVEPIWVSMTGKSIESFRKGLFEPSDSNALRLSQAITAIVGFLLPTLVSAVMLSHRPFKLLGFSSKGIKPVQAGLVLAIIITALLVSTSISYFTELIPITDKMRKLFESMEDEYNRQVTAIISLRSVADYILALIIMAFLPALGEEALFRGGLQNYLSRGTGKPWLAIILVSILFSLAHLSFYGFFSRIFLGVVLGAIYHYSGKLWLSILAHFINNALAISVLYFYMQQGKPVHEAMREEPGSFWGLLALPVVIVLFKIFDKHSRQRTEYSS